MNCLQFQHSLYFSYDKKAIKDFKGLKKLIEFRRNFNVKEYHF